MKRFPTISRSRTSRPGFTLVELVVVVVILGIVSVSVIPAMDNIRAMREGGARDDLVRFMNVAQGMAAASGTTHGLQIDLIDSSITIVQADSFGSPKALIDPLTNADRSVNLQGMYPGVTITTMVNGDGASGSGVVWFDYASNPMTFDTSSGGFVISSQTVSITLSSGERVLVHPFSGTLEVQ